MHKFTESLIERGTLTAKWLLSQLNNDGSIKCTDDLGAYYKCVYPLRCSGNSYAASLLLKQVMKRFYTENGDLRRASRTARHSEKTQCGFNKKLF